MEEGHQDLDLQEVEVVAYYLSQELFRPGQAAEEGPEVKPPASPSRLFDGDALHALPRRAARQLAPGVGIVVRLTHLCAK